MNYLDNFILSPFWGRIHCNPRTIRQAEPSWFLHRRS